jgi:hypothetical protein
MVPGLPDHAPKPHRLETVMMTPIWAPYLQISRRASMSKGQPAATVVRLRIKSLTCAGTAWTVLEAEWKRSKERIASPNRVRIRGKAVIPRLAKDRFSILEWITEGLPAIKTCKVPANFRGIYPTEPWKGALGNEGEKR